MRRALLLLGGGLGAGAWWGRRRHRRRRSELPEATGPDPAEQLRAKLAESRADAVTDEAPPLPDEVDEPIAGEVEASPLDPEARRRTLHERTRGSIDELGRD